MNTTTTVVVAIASVAVSVLWLSERLNAPAHGAKAPPAPDSNWRRLNEKPPSVRGPLKVLGVSIGLMVLLLMLEQGGGGPLTTLAGLCLLVAAGAVVAFLWQAVAGTTHRTRQAIALRTLPSLPAVIADPGDTFRHIIPTIDRPLPKLDANPVRMLDNQKVIGDHVAYLETCEAEAGTAIANAIARYRSDVRTLEDQQIALTRMGHQAGVIVAKMQANFPRMKAELTAVPAPPAITIPATPAYVKASEYDRFRKAVTSGTNHALGRGGAALAQGDWRMALVAFTVTAAMNVIQYQKAVRAMHDGHGTVRRFVDRTRSRLEELATIHTELLKRSQALGAQNAELHGLLTWFNANTHQWDRPDQLTDSAREKFRALSAHAQLHGIAAQRKL